MPQVNANTAIFNNNNLATVPGLTILASMPYPPAKRKLTTYDIARTNRAKVNSGFYNKMTIIVRVGISRDSRDLVEQSSDTLMGLLQGLEKDLLVRQSGGTRKYTCSFADAVLRESGGSYLEMDLVFETSDHFGYDQNDTLLNQVSGYTSGQKTDLITLGGSAAWQVPKIIITISALTTGTSKSVIYGNDNTGQQVTITRTWAAGDVIEIDAHPLAQTVKVNGTEVAWTGAIPEFAPGIGYVSYSDNFSARTMSYTMTYKKRYV